MGAYRLTGQYLGFLPQSPNIGTATFALNVAGTWLGLGFALDGTARTINTVQVYISGVTGTLGTSDLTCDIYSDAGQPNASLGSVSLGSAPSGAGWARFSGLSIANSAETEYWIVLKNANASPGSNFPTYQYGGSGTGIIATQGASGINNWTKLHTSNSGANWGGGQITVSGFSVGFADGTFLGIPVSSITTSADQAFGSNEWGVKFTTPANAGLNVRGAIFSMQRSGASSGSLRYRLYNGTTLLGTSNAVPVGQVNNSWCYEALHFSPPILLPAATSCRLTAGQTGGDASDYYFDPREYTLDTTNLAALAGFGGTLQKTSFNGATWTDTPAGLHCFGLLLDSDGEFASAGGGTSEPTYFET